MSGIASQNELLSIESCALNRPNVFDYCIELQKHEIISFDIFDTLLLRRVEFPSDIFSIIGMEMGFNSFREARINAEKKARLIHFEKYKNREVVLDDIYNVLSDDFGIDSKWKYREIELEFLLIQPNPYMHEVFETMKNSGKTIILMSDMYLPKDYLIELLEKKGYVGYSKIFISNELGLCKGDGTLQEFIKNNVFPGKDIIHIGDNHHSDVEISRSVGIGAITYQNVKLGSKNYRESDIECLAGHIYRGIINSNLHNGKWAKSAYFEHGFKIGGILTMGYCKFIKQICKINDIDLILFCSRDTDIIFKSYAKIFKNDLQNIKYIRVSRFALITASLERYFDDFIARSFEKNLKYGKTKYTLGSLLESNGLCSLKKDLINYGLSTDELYSLVNRDIFKEFLSCNKNKIIQIFSKHTDAAIAYFKDIIENHNNICIVDVGWSGTCITALKYLIEKKVTTNKLKIIGTLACASETKTVIGSIDSSEIYPYICSTNKNKDLLKEQMDENEHINNTLMEYLYSSTEQSLTTYCENKNGKIEFITKKSEINGYAINEIHSGILEFINQYNEICSNFKFDVYISPYVAYAPFRKMKVSEQYNKYLFGNFTDETLANAEDCEKHTFGELFDEPKEKNITLKKNYKILLYSHELTYTGAPHSLFAIATVLLNKGYHVDVWSPKEGEFEKEFTEIGCSVSIISDLHSYETIKKIKTYNFSIANTVFSDKFYKIASPHIPCMWYIREASNLSECINNDHERENTLMNAKNAYCVSEYAAEFIRKYNPNIKVIHNFLPDKTGLSLPHTIGKKINFVQLGTIEFRKGYDTLVGAFEMLEAKEKISTKLYFAGQLRPKNKDYYEDILNRTNQDENITYVGEIKDEPTKYAFLSQMDVVIVASRDESCSLVALEACMLGKPLIVTENVGAKYMVDSSNGWIIPTDDSTELAKTIEFISNHRDSLEKMGENSRKKYEKYASVQSYSSNIDHEMYQIITQYKLTSRVRSKFKGNGLKDKNKKNTQIANCVTHMAHALKQNGISKTLHDSIMSNSALSQICSKIKNNSDIVADDEIIISLTSYPARINNIHLCINSLKRQNLQPNKIILWLAKEQFIHLEKDLPKKLTNLIDNVFEIRWCDDIKSHKKYYYTLKENEKSIVITVDDDVIYGPDLVRTLYTSYKHFPYAISAMRTHRITYNKYGAYNSYKRWTYEDNSLLYDPSLLGVATGVGGVLYPPNLLNKEVFNKITLKQISLNTDDLWLKIMSLANNTPVVLANVIEPNRLIEDSQETALYLSNVYNNINDRNWYLLIEHFDKFFDTCYSLKKTLLDAHKIKMMKEKGKFVFTVYGGNSLKHMLKINSDKYFIQKYISNVSLNSLLNKNKLKNIRTYIDELELSDDAKENIFLDANKKTFEQYNYKQSDYVVIGLEDCLYETYLFSDNSSITKTRINENFIPEYATKNKIEYKSIRSRDITINDWKIKIQEFIQILLYSYTPDKIILYRTPYINSYENMDKSILSAMWKIKLLQNLEEIFIKEMPGRMIIIDNPEIMMPIKKMDGDCNNLFDVDKKVIEFKNKQLQYKLGIISKAEYELYCVTQNIHQN